MKKKEIISSRDYYKYQSSKGYREPWYDEGTNYYRVRNRGYKSYHTKWIQRYQYRLYRTWKYNRKTQYKLR